MSSEISHMSCPNCNAYMLTCFMSWHKIKSDKPNVEMLVRLCYNCRQRLKQEGKIIE